MTGKNCPPGMKKGKMGKTITVPMLGKKKGKKK
jgi:hypothetical protein